jgi:hypothetical protein
MPEHSTGSVGQHFRYGLRIVVAFVVGYHLPKGPPALGVQRLTVGEATRAERRTQVFVVMLRL